MTIEIFNDLSPRKNVADPAGIKPTHPDHQSEAHLSEPTGPAVFFFFVPTQNFFEASGDFFFIISFLHIFMHFLYTVEITRASAQKVMNDPGRCHFF